MTNGVLEQSSSRNPLVEAEQSLCRRIRGYHALEMIERNDRNGRRAKNALDFAESIGKPRLAFAFCANAAKRGAGHIFEQWILRIRIFLRAIALKRMTKCACASAANPCRSDPRECDGAREKPTCADVAFERCWISACTQFRIGALNGRRVCVVRRRDRRCAERCIGRFNVRRGGARIRLFAGSSRRHRINTNLVIRRGYGGVVCRTLHWG